MGQGFGDHFQTHPLVKAYKLWHKFYRDGLMGRISPFAFLAWLDLLLISHPSVILQRISFKRNDFRWESFLKVIWPKFSSQNSLKLCHLNTCQVVQTSKRDAKRWTKQRGKLQSSLNPLSWTPHLTCSTWLLCRAAHWLWKECSSNSATESIQSGHNLWYIANQFHI